jgi:hypothetical protein
VFLSVRRGTHSRYYRFDIVGRADWRDPFPNVDEAAEGKW